MLTKYDFFNCVHIKNNIKHRIRHQGKLINMILIDDSDPDDILGQAAMDKKNGATIDNSYWEEQLKNSKAFVSTGVRYTRSKEVNNKAPDWVEVNSDEIYAMYEQVRAKTGKDVDDDDLGEIITLC